MATLIAGAASVALVALPSAAHAVELTADYDASGTSHIASTDSDIWIKPTTLSVTVDMTTSAISGHLPLKPADTKFHVAGFLPVKAQVNFEEAAPLTGKLGRGRVDTQASYFLRLSDVLIGGIPSPVGSNCRTKEPVVISASTPEGGTFNLDSGGKLTGEYAIGDFEDCLLNTGMINLLVPGTGNTLDVDVANGRLG
ncbi:MAG: hypothetical protein L0H93_20515 [Nocardioides sp.]|nr:hypothetical protein [Nocardioides sp.]